MIRAIEPTDRPAWTQLWKAYLAFYETTLPDEVYASTWSRLLDPSEPTWGALALRDGEPVGLVHWIYHRTNWTIADTCYLQDLFVAPEGRGRGIGSALIDHVAADATQVVSQSSSANRFFLGRSQDDSAPTLHGRLRDVRIYRIALAEPQVATIHANALSTAQHSGGGHDGNGNDARDHGSVSPFLRR